MQMSVAGTAKNLRIRAVTGPTLNSVTFTLRKNGVDTTLTATLAVAGTTATDLVNTVAVAIGDDLSMRVVQNGALGVGALDVECILEYAL
jgi:hypothetical protein